MKFSALSLGLMASAAIAAPTPTVDGPADIANVAKRASITDVRLYPCHLPRQIIN